MLGSIALFSSKRSEPYRTTIDGINGMKKSGFPEEREYFTSSIVSQGIIMGLKNVLQVRRCQGGLTA